ncbi:MAG: tetratricopeptide repeat protein [Flavobacterium sp.]
MRIFLISLLFFSITVFSQIEISDDVKLYNDANAFYEVFNGGNIDALSSAEDRIAVQNSNDENYCFIKAFQNFKKIVGDYPNSTHYLTALYYVGHFEFVESKFTESKKYLLELVKADQSMGYYIRQAFFDLADIAIDEKDYILAQKYVANIENSTPTRFWCGVARNQDEHRVTFIKERLATGLIRK